MENTTRGPDRFRRNSAITVGSVVTGTPRSLTCDTAASSPRLPTDSSLHTGSAANGFFGLAQSTCHSSIVCLSSDSEGTRTRVRSAASFSVMNHAVSVLPVPHAMISCPRSAVVKPLTTSLIADCW